MKKSLMGFVVLLTILGAFFWFWQLNTVEDLVGRWMAFTDPKRLEHLETELSKRSDSELLKLLSHGDSDKAGVAKALLGQRHNPKLFDTYLKMLNDKSQNVRVAARALLQVDKRRASQVYIEELKRSDITSGEVAQSLAILANLKYKAAYPYLVDYAKRPNAWHTAAADYLADFGDPSALPILREMYEAIPKEYNFSTDFAKDRITKAIKTLEAIKQNSQNLSVEKTGAV